MDSIKVETITGIEIQNDGDETNWWSEENSFQDVDYTYDLEAKTSWKFVEFIAHLPRKLKVGYCYLGGEEREKLFRVKSVDGNTVFIEVLADLTKDKLEVPPEAMKNINIVREEKE